MKDKVIRHGTFEIDFKNRRIRFIEINSEYEDLSDFNDEYFIEFEEKVKNEE